MKIGFLWLALTASILFLVGCTSTGNTVLPGKDIEVTMYKDAKCGCCVGYAAALESQGYKVNKINTVDMGLIKSQYTIPGNMESCHTAIVGGYFVEGHVPLEAVQKLLDDQPNIDGIALPNMPAGSPGMPGVKRGPFTIYAITNGAATVFMEV